MGIRGKLIASLSGILVTLTLVLGTAFAVREQEEIADLKRDHLRHSAQLASRLLLQTDKDDSQRVLDTWNNTTQTGPRFRVVWSGDHGAEPTQANTATSDAAEVMTVSVPLRAASSAAPGRLIAAEPLPDAQSLLLGILADHLALGVFLTAAAALGVAVVCQRIVVRPIRWLVSAADGMAQGENWDPIQSVNRRQDEIGVLGDHLAELSRRLSSAVRSARHGSAHLVAVGVRRELEEPLQRLTLSIATIDAAASDDLETKREVQEMEQQLNALRQVANRLANVAATPRG